MATVVSAQSGNFSATSTWVGGVVPVDGDSFTISTGHTVTYDVATPVTNGFNDSNIYGVLQSASGVSTTLRMNGRLNIRTSGTYHARSGHTLQFKGTAAASHILYQYAENGASLVMEGSDGMPCTTLATTANERSTSLSFTDASKFAAGEWIAVFDNTTSSSTGGATTLRDEGFWIHDISGNTVYIRQFVGPESTIVAAASSNITVLNAKVFRVGQMIIFGTGANRNIHTITDINYTTHVITLSGTITGTVIGLTVYETGSDKIHSSAEKIRKVATVTTVTSDSTSTTITVASANMFSAGDDVWIEARSECGGPSDYAYTAYGDEAPGPRYKHTISSVDGNVITLTAAVGYNVVQGALVSRLTRDVVVESITPNADYYGVYSPSYTSNYDRKLIIKDVYFKYIGSSNGTAEGGIYSEGHYSANSPAVTLTQQVAPFTNQPWFEGISMTGSNSTRDYGGFWNRARYGQIRCSIAIGRFDSSLVSAQNAGLCTYNSIAVGSNSWGLRYEGVSEWFEIAYNYISRCYRGSRQNTYDTGLGVHHMIYDANDYSIHTAGRSAAIHNYKFKITGTRRGVVAVDGSYTQIYSSQKFLSAYSTESTNQVRGNFHAGHIDRSHNQVWFTSVEHDFEIDAIFQSGYGSFRHWDASEWAWRVINASDFDDYGVGWFESVYIPAGVAVAATARIKLAPNYSGSYPWFECRDVVQGIAPNRVGNAGGHWSSWVAGGSTSVRYTSAAANAYEAKTLTLPAVPFQRYVNIGVHVDNRNASEGYWLKDIDISMSSQYPNHKYRVINSQINGRIDVNYNANSSTKIRIGGRFN